ncbi:MAG: PAS domain-containing sensor histidine kinase [Cyanobacteria bacterium SZAS TMP-1]|nr:PAS domain-containing sensor histidine kinase [Cyanobacteria bacterium SZAS TMP-1]
MPLPQLSLLKKMILLLSLPAAVQLGITGGMLFLEYRTELQVQKADHARQIHDSINQLIKDLYQIMSSCENRTLTSLGPGNLIFGPEQSSIYKQYSLLKDLLKDSPADLAIVQTSERSALAAMAIVQQVKEMLDQGDIGNRPERRPMIMQLRRLTSMIASRELVDLANRQSQIVDAGPTKLRRLRQEAWWILGLGSFAELILFVALAQYLIQGVALRLDRLVDNTESLAQQAPLHPVDEGDDEIGLIDKTMHDMARSIEEITAKQMAVVDNAGDMIVSMDENGQITSTNAAGGKLFGCHQAELIGKNYRDIVNRKDIDALSNHLLLARANNPVKPVPLRMVGRARRPLYAVWSAQWVESEGQYFAVVHDLTQLKEAEQMKQEVVSIVRQDLSVPLSNLSAFLNRLEDGASADTHALASARRNANQMQMLINDLVDMEKAKNGMLVISADHLYLDKIIDMAQVLVAPFAEEKGVVLDCRRSGLTVNGEEDKLVRVLVNLLGNAVQFAPRETSILLVSKSQDGYAQISITDKGPGIAAEQLGTIFDAFTPGEITADEAAQSNAANSPGSGLSLAISKAFVELHGGKISVTSKPGAGTTITFTLPLAAAEKRVATT